MIFRPELAAAVVDGSKTVTRRLPKPNPRSPWYEGGCKLTVGQDVAVCPGRGQHAIGRATVTSVDLVRLDDLDDAEARREGFTSAEEFERTFRAINGKQDPALTVWRIGLRSQGSDAP